MNIFLNQAYEERTPLITGRQAFSNVHLLIHARVFTWKQIHIF